MSGEPLYDPLDHTPSESAWRTVTRWLIILNVAVFLLDYFVIRRGFVLSLVDDRVTVQEIHADKVLGQPIVQTAQPMLAFFDSFSVYTAIMKLQVWRFVSYQFVHANMEHILLNMFGLLMIGPLVERRMGKWNYLGFYLACGCAGPAAHIVLSQLRMTQLNIFTPLVGASASIYGVMVAAARIAPNEEVMLAIPPIDMKLKNFVLILVLLSAAAVTWHWQNAGGHAAHLGGAVAGWFLSRRYAERNNGPRLSV